VRVKVRAKLRAGVKVRAEGRGSMKIRVKVTVKEQQRG